MRSMEAFIDESLEAGDWDIQEEWPSGLIISIGGRMFNLEEVEES